MAIGFTIYTGKRLILTQGKGSLIADDLFEYYRALRSHPDFDGTFDELFDVTEADVVNISSNELKQFSTTTAVYTEKGQPVKVAVVAPSDLEFALSRMYEQIQSGNRIQVFRERAAAEKWLEVDLD